MDHSLSTSNSLWSVSSSITGSGQNTTGTSAHFASHDLLPVVTHPILTSIHNGCEWRCARAWEQSPLRLLPCHHIVHSDCYQPMLKAYGNHCATCYFSDSSAPLNDEEIREFSNIEALVADTVPMKCQNPSCTTTGTRSELSGDQSTCPFPMSRLALCPRMDFIKTNGPALVKWMNDSIGTLPEEYRYVNNVKFVESLDTAYIKEDQGKPAITYDGQVNGCASQFFIISPQTSPTVESHFTSFLRELRTDMAFIALENIYPELFDRESKLFIGRYNFLLDSITLETQTEKATVPVSSLIQHNPSLAIPPELNWDTFRSAIEKFEELYYEDLFTAKETKKKKRKKESPESFPTPDKAGSSKGASPHFFELIFRKSTAPCHNEAENAKCLPPSGIMTTSHILF